MTIFHMTQSMPSSLKNGFVHFALLYSIFCDQIIKLHRLMLMSLLVCQCCRDFSITCYCFFEMYFIIELVYL